MAYIRYWLPLLLFSASTVSADDFRLLVPRFNQTGPGPQDYECVSERAPDYYGIGVRLGIYFSWWTSWVANAALDDEIFGGLDQNAVFLFANIIAMVRCTITKVLTQLDCLILVHLGTGSIFGVLSIWGYRTCTYSIHGSDAVNRCGGFGTHFRLLLSASVSAFSVWFWYSAVLPGSRLLNNDEGPCLVLRTFMFGNVRADGGVRIFYLITTISATIFFCTQVLVATIPGYMRIKRMFTMTKQERFETVERLRYSTGMNYLQLRYLHYGLRVFSFIFIIWSMILVEFTLNYNHVKEVLGPDGRIYFPSQLIPMIIGAFTFCRVVYKRIDQSIQIHIHEHKPEKDETFFTPIKRIHSGKAVLKFLEPLTYVARPVKNVKPEDEEIDERMEHEYTWLRVLVSFYPWLSLLSRWNSRTPEKPQQGPRPEYDEEKRAESDTLRSTPSPKHQEFKIDFSRDIPDDSISQAMERFSSDAGRRNTIQSHDHVAEDQLLPAPSI